MKKEKKQGMTDPARMLGVIMAAVVLLASAGCTQSGKKQELYHRFPDQVWARFNLLQFEIPLEKPGEYDISLFAAFTPGYTPSSLDFNMIMNTPSGEERTNEYTLPVKNETGTFIHGCAGDSCAAEIMLKKGITLGKKGLLRVEIENLIPKISTPGILGVGIRVVPSR